MNLAISENQSVWERGREVDGVTSSSKYKAKNNVHYFKKNIKHSIESNIHIKQGDVTEWFEKNEKKNKNQSHAILCAVIR